MQRLIIDDTGRFIEMQKSDAADFIRKCLDETPGATVRIQHTSDSIRKIKQVYNEEPWPDFQVL